MREPAETVELLNLVQVDLTVAALLTALVTAASILAFVLGLYRERSYRAVRSRLDSLSDQRPEALLDPEVSFTERVLKPTGRTLLARLGRFTPSGNLELVRRQLVMAGNPGNLAVIDFLGLKMLAAIVLAVLTGLYFVSRGTTGTNVFLYSFVGGGVGLYLPNWWLKQRISKRKEQISRDLPDALDMLTTMVDAGLGFDMALVRLCEKWDSPLAQEFERMVNEMRMGVRKVDALRNMVNRVDVTDLSTFAAVLIQADHLGISVARILHTQSEQMRLKRRQRIEESAAKMPLKMLPIIVLFIFPALFAIILGPAVPQIIGAFSGI